MNIKCSCGFVFLHHILNNQSFIAINKHTTHDFTYVKRYRDIYHYREKGLMVIVKLISPMSALDQVYIIQSTAVCVGDIARYLFPV